MSSLMISPLSVSSVKALYPNSETRQVENKEANELFYHTTEQQSEQKPETTGKLIGTCIAQSLHELKQCKGGASPISKLSEEKYDCQFSESRQEANNAFK